MSKAWNVFVVAALGACVSAAAAGPHKLSDRQIREKFTGRQLTDEVHYRFVFERDQTLRSYSMGVKKVGRWLVEAGELCLYLGETDDGCYEVIISGDHIELAPTGLGGSIDGILEPPERRLKEG